MTIEEKAKAYDKALEKARELYSNAAEGYRFVYEDLFPELKESEDERVRKGLIDYFNDFTLPTFGGLEPKKILAWLEKQGSQILANSGKTCKDERSQPTNYTLEQAARIFLDALSDTPYNNKPVTDAQVITRELLKFLSDAHSYNPNAINEQNPAWSEEDEERLNSIIESYKDLLRDYKACHDVDYIPYDSSTVVRTVVNDVNYLKSLKERCTWKPSEEQLETLNEVIKEAIKMGGRLSKYSKKLESLESLYNDLKALSEK